METFQDYH